MSRASGSLHVTSNRVLRYSEDLVHDLKLLEIDASLMEELESGGRLQFKGVPDDPTSHHAEAVLVTSRNTYEVREVETTNLVMLIDGSRGGDEAVEGVEGGELDASPVTVHALAKAHLELTLINPKLDMLDEAMKKYYVITDIVSDAALLPKGVTWDSLQDSVQASDEEISRALEDSDVVRVNGRWMGVSPDALSSFVKLVVLTATERGVKLDAVQAVEMAIALESSGVCGQVTLQLLNKLRSSRLADDAGRKLSVEDLDRPDWREMPGKLPVIPLDLSLICKHIGVGILLEQEFYEDKDEFLRVWAEMVPDLPDGMEVGMAMLRGEAIEVEGEALGAHGVKVGRTSVRRLCVGEMPRDTLSRFECLWKAKEKWTLQDILPYIDGLSAPGQNTEELLLKWARPSQTRPDDPVLYTKR